MPNDFLAGFTALLIAQLIGETLARLLGLTIPGPVVGLLLMVVALRCSDALYRRVKVTADLLLAHLSLLFVPAGVGVTLYLRSIGEELLAIAGALILSAWIGLAVTIWVTHRLSPRSQ
jgi:holin-like protein